MKTFKRILSIMLMLATVLCIVVPAMADSTATGKYNTAAVNLRKSIGGSSYGLVSKNATCTILKQETVNSVKWYQVTITSDTANTPNLKGKTGWSQAKFIDVTSGTVPGDSSGGNSGGSSGGTTTPTTPTTPYINTNKVNIRQFPNQKSSAIGQVNAKTTLEVLGTAEGTVLNGSNIWLNVKIIKSVVSKDQTKIDGRIGYVHSSFVSGYSSSNTPTGRPSSIVEAFGASTLKYGSKGNYVINLQKALKHDGTLVEGAKIDGIFGAKTTESVKAFQKKYSILLQNSEYDKDVVDGLVGPKTKEVLWKYCGEFLKEEGVI